MRILYDTSVIVAATVAKHPHHDQAIDWLKRAKNKEIKMVVASHTLAECYSVLSSLSITPRLTPSVTHFLLQENITKHAEPITITSQDYIDTIETISKLGLSGGIIYDALLVKAALNAKVNHILTLNKKDFSRLLIDHPKMLIVPA